MNGPQSVLVQLLPSERERGPMDVHFSSATDLWSTPQDVFDELNEEFRFTTDVCATPENAKCRVFFTDKIGALAQEWTGACWMNPPYGRSLWRWIQKAYDAATKGATVVCLVPARTDTDWWHRWVLPFAEVRYIKGRLKFGGAKNSAPFPSAVVIFRPQGNRADS